jgi:uncharacterized protein YceH (UPF0502 family)
MDNDLIQLEPEEQRVLGALIEKSIATPDHYPLTLNSLTTACNQKSARNPVVNYDPETVQLALSSLKKKELCGTESGSYSRTTKYQHRFKSLFNVSDDQIAIICLLLLRGPQTPGELKSNSGRLYSFSDLAEVHESVRSLSESDSPFIYELNRRPGQKEARVMHLFGGKIAEEAEDETSTFEAPRKPISEMENRIEKLETELHELKERFEKLMEELG